MSWYLHDQEAPQGIHKYQANITKLLKEILEKDSEANNGSKSERANIPGAMSSWEMGGGRTVSAKKMVQCRKIVSNSQGPLSGRTVSVPRQETEVLGIHQETTPHSVHSTRSTFNSK